MRQGVLTRRRRSKISEQVFYESLEAPPETVAGLKIFLGKAQDLGLIVDTGQGSLMLKTEDGEFNFATFRTDGTVRNYRIAKRTQAFGFPEVGERYLEKLASLFPGGKVDSGGSDRFRWTVKKNGRYLTVTECLEVQDRWLDLLRKTMEEICSAMR